MSENIETTAQEAPVETQAEPKKEPRILKISVLDRILGIRFVQVLHCTWTLRVAYQKVVDILTPTDDEKTKAGIYFDNNGNPHAKSDFITEVDFADFPPEIIKAIRTQIEFFEEARRREHGDIIHKIYHDWCRVYGEVIGYEEIPDTNRPEIVYE